MLIRKKEVKSFLSVDDMIIYILLHKISRNL